MRDERLGERVVALELAVTPDRHGLARELSQTYLQKLVESFDPTLEPFVARPVVDVCVGDEDFVFKVRERRHLATSLWCRALRRASVAYGRQVGRKRVVVVSTNG